MGEVVSLAAHREEQGQHGTGVARCLACKHEWSAVAPIGTVALTCPGCGSGKGMFKYAYSPEVGETCFSCLICTSQHFYFVQQNNAVHITCAGCGSPMSIESVFGQA